MLESYLVQTCRKITPVRNNFGDYLYDGTYEELSCRFRHIMGVERGNNQELTDTDAMAWFANGSGVGKGDILYFDGQYFQVQRVNFARKLGSNNIEFIKCDLKITEVGIS